jgi:hypothetical protein
MAVSATEPDEKIQEARLSPHVPGFSRASFPELSASAPASAPASSLA